MISLNKKSKGFTIVELLIVIVVIAILATLVIVTFTGIQQKARDSQRQTDIDAVQSHLEAFYANNGYYPTLHDLQDTAVGGFVATQLKGLDPQSLISPEGDAIAGAAGTGAAGWAYGYTTTGCTATSASSTTNECTAFTVTANLEGGGSFAKSSNT